ncbi:MAG: trans-sulfuration enzyme family protein [Rhodospirillales bacterium]
MAKNLDITAAGPSTLAVHAGEKPDPVTGASSPSIVMASTYVTEKPQGFSAHEMTPDSPYIYTRWGNPTVRQLEEKISALEGAEATACYGSGMAAAAALMLGVLSAGDRLIVSEFSYAGIAELVRDTLPRFGIEVVLVDMCDMDALEAALKPGAKLVFADTPNNPTMRLTDLEAVANLARAHGALSAVDNTFASPAGTNPLASGVDYVVHSLTKYVCGHGDALGGSVSASAKRIQALVAEATVHLGGTMSPFNAWLIARGAATLPLRMQAHEANAHTVAKFLEAHPAVERVMYPGLKSHPQHDLAKRQMRNTSAMMSFRLKGGLAVNEAAAERIATDAQIIHYAVSLGHHRTLVCWMPTASLLETSFRVDAAGQARYREWAGDGVFRLSVGLEDADDICADLDRVLSA